MSKVTQRVFLHIKPSGWKRTTRDGVEFIEPTTFTVDRMTKQGPPVSSRDNDMAVMVDLVLDTAIFAKHGVHAVLEVTEDNILSFNTEAGITITPGQIVQPPASEVDDTLKS